MSDILTQRGQFHPTINPQFYQSRKVQQTVEASELQPSSPAPDIFRHARYCGPSMVLGNTVVGANIGLYLSNGWTANDSQQNLRIAGSMVATPEEQEKALSRQTTLQSGSYVAVGGSLSNQQILALPTHLNAEWIAAFGISTINTSNVPQSAALGNSWPANGHFNWITLESRYRNWSFQTKLTQEDDDCCPTTEALRCAASFALRAALYQLPVPLNAIVDGDGEIIFRWKNGESTASCCFTSDGNIVAYAHQAGKSAMFKLDELYAETLGLSGFFEAIRAIL